MSSAIPNIVDVELRRELDPVIALLNVKIDTIDNNGESFLKGGARHLLARLTRAHLILILLNKAISSKRSTVTQAKQIGKSGSQSI